MAQPRILIIEDERGLTQSLSWFFKREGYEVTVADDGREGLHKAQTALPDVVLLDVMLPGMNGLDVCRELRAGDRTRDIPVIMITAKTEETDQVVGYSLGADDYVGKPFSNKVLLAKVKALLRRVEGQDAPGDVTENSGVKIDRVRHRVTLEDEPLDLTPTEFSLLELLMRHAGQVVTRRMLCEHLWEVDWEGTTNVIEVHVNRLRNKLDKLVPTPMIETVRGRGYAVRAS